jgi:hypothetical protein
MGLKIFAPDHPLVLDGSHDEEGYTPAERRAQARRQAAIDAERGVTKGPTMRLFDDDKVGCYLDAIGHRLEKTSDNETKVVDLTLRVQPLTPEMSTSLDPDVRNFLFTLTDATPRQKLKSVHFALTVPNQQLTVHLLPEMDGQIVFADVEINDVKARTQKDVDGYALVFYASYGPASPRDLEYFQEWYTQQRFVTFHPQEPALDFSGKEETEPVETARRVPRRHPKAPPIEPGDELRPGTHAEH